MRQCRRKGHNHEEVGDLPVPLFHSKSPKACCERDGGGGKRSNGDVGNGRPRVTPASALGVTSKENIERGWCLECSTGSFIGGRGGALHILQVFEGIVGKANKRSIIGFVDFFTTTTTDFSDSLGRRVKWRTH